jgi:Tfp pilus assembly protein PilF
MKKLILVLSIIFIGCETNQNRDNATWSFDSSTGDYIEWQSDNDFANEMTNAAFVHLYNVEYEKAMVFFEKALEYDPSLFGPHVVLAGLSPEGSEKSEMHIKKAKENVADNNDTSKLFVSLLDLPRQSRWWPLLGPGAHDKWAEMRSIEPKGKLIHFYYSFTIPGLENKIREMESLLSELRDGVGETESLAVSGDHSYMIAPITNVLGYFYYNQGDKEKAKSLFEEYIDLHPNGYNSYDSMGEFYYNEGDKESAKRYYSKAVENYFGANTANGKLRELNAE